MEATFLRLLLGIYAAAAFIFSLYYLYHRRVTLFEYVLWGTVALIVPVLGPFFVIAARPGPRKYKLFPRKTSRKSLKTQG
jgi:hypothetical protein